MKILSEIKKSTLFSKAIVLAIILQINALQASPIIIVTATDGTIADDGLCSISEAIISANTDTASGATTGECVAGVTGLDTINLTTDVVFQNFYQDEPTFGHTSTPTISSHLIIDGVGHTLQRNNSLNCNINEISTADEFRILYVSSTGILDLKNISIKNGCADGNSFNRRAGGGILNGGILTIDNSELSANTSELGGSILNFGTITSISNSLITNNHSDNLGGGIFNQSIITEISNSLITNNHSDNLGGGIFNQSIITEITNNWFTGNSALAGAGITNLVGSIGIISQNTFSNNQAMQDGGGIFSHDSGSVTEIVNNTFSANSANFGAGLYNYNSTISSLINNTFSENSANFEGGGIFNRGTLLGINNNLFNKNIANSNKDCHIADGTVSGSNNLSNQASNNCTAANIGSGLDSNTVKPLADNGCMTPLADGTCVKTHALLVGSEAIDSGDVNATNNDQRGFVINGVRDIGAFERQTALGQCSQNQTDAIFNVSSALELNDAIICANQNAATTDTINFTQNITLNTHYDDITTGLDPMGKTGTQAIESAITINGNGYRLQRNPNINCVLNDTKETGEFRLMRLQGSNANLSLKHIVLEGGCADGPVTHNGIAGGIYLGGGTLSIENSLLDNNQAKNVAGAVYLIDAATTLTVLDSTFSFNKSGKGGALYSNGIITNIENSTFSGNEANGYLSESQGGAIWNNNQISAILNNTFSGNSAVNNSAEGGALYTALGHTISQMNNNLFHNNTATTNADCYEFTPANVTGSYNASDKDSNNCTAVISFILDTAEISPLADNGCVTPLADGTCIKTHALSIFSLAVNSGVNATNHDQRGFVPVLERDLGAFESSSYDDVFFKNSFE